MYELPEIFIPCHIYLTGSPFNELYYIWTIKWNKLYYICNLPKFNFNSYLTPLYLSVYTKIHVHIHAHIFTFVTTKLGRISK